MKVSIRNMADNPRGSIMILLYRIANFSSRSRKRSWIHWIWSVPILIIYRFITELYFGYEIPAATVIGKGLFIDHGYGIVINKHSIIGRSCRIKHGVTIGCKTMPDGTQGPSPIIGDRVDIGANAVVLGGIVVGSDVKIGAGAVVTKSVPDGAVVRGRSADFY